MIRNMLIVLVYILSLSTLASSFLPNPNDYLLKHAAFHYCNYASSGLGSVFGGKRLVQAPASSLALLSSAHNHSTMDQMLSSRGSKVQKNRDNRCRSFENIASLGATPNCNNPGSQRKLGAIRTWERWIASATLGFMLLVPLAVNPAHATTPLDGLWRQSTTTPTATTKTVAVLTAGTTPSLRDAITTASISPDSAVLEDPSPLPSPTTVETRAGVLDEVWRLVSKYYVDKTYNGKDWNAIRERYESQDTATGEEDSSKTMSLAKSMVSNLGDKYSRILDKESYERIQKFDLIGVGATLIGNDSKQIMVGGPPIRGSAADRAGLQAGDYIMSVNGVPTLGRTSFDIIDQVNEGTPPRKTITFTVAKGGDTSNVVDMELERSFVEVNNPISYKLDARDGKHKVGYVRIREFNSLVNTKVREALLDLKSQGANAFVLDLRSNPGGAFQSAVDVASLFMENKVATYFVDGNNIKTPFTTSTKNVVVDEADPVVIWLDRGSASASEIFAGAMHDNCRAIVMGDRSFGKGLIQSVFGLENGSGLVLTVAQYVTPNGSVIQGSGIRPDIQAKLPIRIPFLGSDSDTSVVNFHQVSDLQSKLCSTGSSSSSSTSTVARSE